MSAAPGQHHWPRRAKNCESVAPTVEVGGAGVGNVDGDDLPVGLALVDEGKGAEHLHLLHLAAVAGGLADVAHVERIVVALGLSLRVGEVGVLPSLRVSD